MNASTSEVAQDAVVGVGARLGAFCVVGLDPDGVEEPVRLGAHATLRSHTVVYRGVTVGERLQTGHATLIREFTSIGDDVSLGSHSVIEHHVTIGHRVRLHSNCFVPEFTVLEDGAWLGPGVIITNARYPNRPDTKDRLDGVTVGTGAAVGAGAILLPGVVIGAGALIGAGAVVAADVEPGATVVGVPARSVR